MKVKVKCQTVVYFDQEIDITKDEYAALRKLDGEEVTLRHNTDKYNIINGYLDYDQIISNNAVYTSFQVSRRGARSKLLFNHKAKTKWDYKSYLRNTSTGFTS
ncbi:MAG: hypothetical protein JWO03_916 [Bacteroidetes bacterium]|nr:hypothetical protein [Bacteroidota bacterium]